MKQLCYALMLTVASAGVSCVNQEGLMDEPAVGSTSLKGKTITEEEAILRARKAMVDFGFWPASRGDEKSVKEKVIITDSKSDTLMIAINFEAGGFSLVNAREEGPEIIGVSETGAFSQEIPENVESYVSAISSNHRWTIDEKLELQPVLKCEAYELDDYPNVVCLNLHTPAWHQGSPFNKFCPTGAGGQNCLAGCGPVALGEIFAYHRTPSKADGYALDWGKMLQSPLNKMGENGVAHLLAGIGSQSGTSYGLYASSTTKDGMLACLQANSFNKYSITGSYSAVINSIRQHGPVLVLGFNNYYTGHAWVADGYRIVTQKIKPAEWEYPQTPRYESDVYLHFNWGWGGSCNGYFVTTQDYVTGSTKYFKECNFVIDIY